MKKTRFGELRRVRNIVNISAKKYIQRHTAPIIPIIGKFYARLQIRVFFFRLNTDLRR